MQKTWQADVLFPYLYDFYREAEQLTGERFFYSVPICIPFLSIEEQNDWMSKSDDVYTKSQYKDFIDDKFGGLILRSAGYLDTTKYLEAVAKLFTIEKDFDYTRTDKTVIFCEGVNVSNNPYFDWVPVKKLKGETLTITLDKTPPVIFNRGVYVVPSGNNTWRVGATYSHDTMEGPTESGRHELDQKLRSLLRIPYTVTNHSWGIRPTTPDRRPIVGPHPEHKNMVIFNGMGTKGVSLTPWSSGILSGYLEEGRQIKNDINISRFYALYSKFRD